MADIRLAFLWHHHQPLYRDLVSGEVHMPWARLHGAKDYYGMARLLEEADGAVRATINLTPVLLDQLDDCASGRASDPHLVLSSKPAGELTAAERAAARDVLTRASPRLIDALPRYRELCRKRGRLSTVDLRDLQVLANLAWLHRTLLEDDEGLAELVAKGRGFTEEDKAHVLTRQREVIAEIVPLHRRLAAAGIAEITTSPYYHPILPLLVDPESARVALPDAPLPEGRVPLVEDARAQLRLAAERHADAFGDRPRGLWPSEGSVSPGILPLVAAEGFAWLASDEGVLAASRGVSGRREDDLYRPWRLRTPEGDVAMVFRDRALSDAISFEYCGWDGAEAASDLVSRIRASARRFDGRPLVTVALDGENPWEHYAEGGLPFLRTLYSRLADADDIETVRISDHLAECPPEREIGKLHCGSWIDASFAVWVGHPQDVRAWEALYRVRADLVRLDPDRSNELAWRCLYAAEGSDWTWWYGDDRTSGRDHDFDALYRTHLGNVHRSLGVEPPAFLGRPVG